MAHEHCKLIIGFAPKGPITLGNKMRNTEGRSGQFKIWKET